MFYKTEEATTCDICEGEECNEKCSPQALRQQDERKDEENTRQKVLFKTAQSSTPKLMESALIMIFGIFCVRLF